MTTDIEIKTAGVRALVQALGEVDAEKFIALIQREPFGDSGSGWHVGFFLAGDPKAGYVALLGGNQRNRVCRRWFVGLIDSAQRWPG